MALFLGLDVGTQGTKGLVVDVERACVVARAGAGYELIAGLPPGCAEQHPQTWLDAVRAVCGQLSSEVDLREVRGVGVSGQQHGAVLLDEQGEVVRPAKLWCDTSTATEAQELSARFGRALPVGFTASKLAWVARHEPENWERVRQVLLPHDYVNFVLSGVACMEYGDASGTGLFDPEARDFVVADQLALDPRLPALLPALVEPGVWIGGVDARGAQLTGLREGVPLSTGGGDNMMSAVGSGATEPGVVVCSLGTSGTLFTHAERPVVDPEGLIAPFCGSTGGWLPLLCVMNATGVTEEVRSAFGRTHAELTRAALEVEAGCDGLLWVPYLVGERVPDLPRATGTLLGMRPGCLEPGRLYRAALEGVSLNLAWGAERMRGLGLAVDEVRLAGGASNNPLWRAILAACMDAPVIALEEPESAALGAALHAAWTHARELDESARAADVARPLVRLGDERAEPDPAWVERYAELGARLREAVAASAAPAQD